MKTENKSNILLLATTSYAGMGPYVASIVNSFDATDNVFFFLVEHDEMYYSRNIKKELLPKCKIFHSHLTKIKTLLNITIYPRSGYYNELKGFCIQNNINTMHCLTQFSDSSFIRWFHKRGKVIITVHDLIQHESKKSFLKEFRENVIFKRVKKSIEICQYLVTNSESQFSKIRKTYPEKDAFYSPFPTLITDAIANGNKIPEEINNEKDYILFFGRIEEYKGLSILLEAYLKSGVKEKLVIAGKGDFAEKKEHPNIIYINRYIADEEIRPLYLNAKYVVYPYISATQSGVLSVASYFGKPMILSNVPFFIESIGDNESSLFFEAGDSSALSESLKKISSMDLSKMAEQSKQLYKEKYSDLALKKALHKIYQD